MTYTVGTCGVSAKNHAICDQRRQFRWYKRASDIWTLGEVGKDMLSDVAEVRHVGGRQWRATLMWPGHDWWSMCGSTKRGRALIERYLGRKVWDWEDCELLEPTP